VGTLTRRKRGGVAVLLCAAAVSASAQTFTTLVSFDRTNGAFPFSSVVQGADGNFYGTTLQGGTSNAGTLFKVSPGGTLTELHSFDRTDGAQPWDAPILGSNGGLYGTTGLGGAYRDGTVFEITPTGTLRQLHSFSSTDGSDPVAGLVEGADGNFYGVTKGGGAYLWGTVFKITPSGILTTLHSFAGYPTDGAAPAGALVQGTDGSFYGTTQEGGAYSPVACYGGDEPILGCGTIFKITPDGALTILHSFDYYEEGGNPAAGLVERHRRGLLWDNAGWRAPEMGYNLQNHLGRHTDDSARLPKDRRLCTRGRANSSERRELLRDNSSGRSRWLWHGLQDDPAGCADNPIQSALRCSPLLGRSTAARHRREFLWDDPVRPRVWLGLHSVRRTRPVRSNAAYVR